LRPHRAQRVADLEQEKLGAGFGQRLGEDPDNRANDGAAGDDHGANEHVVKGGCHAALAVKAGREYPSEHQQEHTGQGKYREHDAIGMSIGGDEQVEQTQQAKPHDGQSVKDSIHA